MVTAKFEYGHDSGFIRMDVKGHAGFAEAGQDPVCAGASVLAMTVAQCLVGMEDEGKLQKKMNRIIRNGRVSVVVKPKPEHLAEALHIFWIGETGFQLLAEAYPDNIEFTPFGGPEEA